MAGESLGEIQVFRGAANVRHGRVSETVEGLQGLESGRGLPLPNSTWIWRSKGAASGWTGKGRSCIEGFLRPMLSSEVEAEFAPEPPY